MPNLVIYHKNCSDGFASAWSARQAFFERKESAEYVPMLHADTPPDVTGKDVYICDIAFPRPILLELKEKAKSLIVLDHHKTAEEDLKGLDFCVFDMTRSGAAITWDYFFNENKPGFRHWLINYVQDRDLWKWELPGSREVSEAIYSNPYTFEAWDDMALKSVYLMTLEGTAIRRATQKQIDMSLNRAYWGQLGDYIVPVVNTEYHSSEIGNLLSKNADFAVCWSQVENGRFRYSLRSQGFDVAKVAQGLFGGGGHAQAAGFTTDSLVIKFVSKFEPNM